MALKCIWVGVSSWTTLFRFSLSISSTSVFELWVLNSEIVFSFGTNIHDVVTSITLRYQTQVSRQHPTFSFRIKFWRRTSNISRPICFTVWSLIFQRIQPNYTRIYSILTNLSIPLLSVWKLRKYSLIINKKPLQIATVASSH